VLVGFAACARRPLPDVVLGGSAACARHGRGPDARQKKNGGREGRGRKRRLAAAV